MDIFGDESQAQFSQRMYNARAQTYDDSWHPDYSKRFMSIVKLRPGDRILDLCCGTGLEAFIAAEDVGPDGQVVGIDVTEGMLAIAKVKAEKDTKLGPRLRFIQHDVTNLETLVELENDTFDVILCSNAFVLFDEPAKVVASWHNYLKPGGRLVVDITHERNLRSGLLLERVAARMELKSPLHRSWIKSKDSFADILTMEGYTVEDVHLIEKIAGQEITYCGLDQADEQFDYVTNLTFFTPELAAEEFKQNARPIFREEWEKAAVNGNIENVDALYVYVARKE